MPLFFGLGRPIEATADIVALTGVTGYLAYIWSKVDPVSSWLLAPYLGWLGFATYLCVGLFLSIQALDADELQAGFGYLNNWNTSKKESSKKE
jgi:translocator protein